MLISLISAAALAMTVQAQPELQPNAQPAAPEAQAQAEETRERRDPNERICERRQVTGSGIGRRVCYTRAEMEARSEADRQRLEGMQGAVTVDQSNGFAPPQ